MAGQGSPHIAPFYSQRLDSGWFGCALRVGYVLGCLLLASSAIHAQDEIDVGLRITWGGDQARLWRGSIRVENGTLREPRRLGYEVDLPGSWRHNGNSLRFDAHSPSSFDGFDVFVRAARESTVTILLEPNGQPGARTAQSFPVLLDNLLSKDAVFIEPLGDGQNRLLVRRIPGDSLRVKFTRNSLVFDPGEPFPFQLIPHLLGLPPDTPLSCVVQLQDAAQTVHWSDNFDLRSTEQGVAEPIPPITIPLPTAEGVYDVVISLSEKGLLDTFVRPKSLAHRKVQLVVIGDTSPPEDKTDFVELETLRLGEAPRFDIRRRLQSAVGASTSVPFVGQLDKWEHLDRSLHRIRPGDFYATPLPISRVGVPHLLEIEYANDVPQTLGVSVIEANAEGAITPIQVDSGIEVGKQPFRSPSQMERHAVVFWPRTKQPWMLLTNRRSDAPAVVGKIRVLHGPDRLRPAGLSTPRGEGRLLAAFFDKPLFLENFSAPEATDERTDRSLRDWHTFFEGGKRLVEYLKYAGYNGAVLSVARDGSALYPSQWLEPTPRYDNGTFFFTGQDPLRKDVLEALFRLFDREGLTLFPAIHLGTSLPELEHLLASGGPRAVGVVSVNGAGAPWRNQRRGQGPHYNPLNPQVQQAIARVVDELADRYAKHPSFGGLALQVSPSTFMQLPGPDWALDDDTVARFAAETKIQLPRDHSKRTEYLLGPVRQQWLQWRSEQLTNLQRDLQSRVALRQPESQLLLLAGDMVKGWSVERTMHPRLLRPANFAAAMLDHGLAGIFVEDRGSIVQLRPRRIAPHANLAMQATNIALNRSTEVDKFYRGVGSGALCFHEPQPLRLQEFDEQGPFPHEKSLTWLAAQIPPAGLYNRARFVHAVATLDPPMIVEGGWTLPLGQEHSVREIFNVYRQLPAQPFTTEKPQPGLGIVVRTLSQTDRTFIYVVNDAPWPAQVQIALNAPPHCTALAVGGHGTAQLKHWPGQASWMVDLRPYDLVAAVFSAPRVRVTDWRVEFDSSVKVELARTLTDLQSRIARLKRPPVLEVLENPSFEEPPTATDPVPGWYFQQQAGVLVEIEERAAAAGKRALHFKNNTSGVAWVRSKPIRLPKTGRIAVQAAIRTADPADQPALRVAFDLQGAGPNSYLIKAFGRDPSGKETRRLARQWPSAPYTVYWNELPVGTESQVRIGFDLSGEGEVWIDDVRILDLHFDQNEQRELLKKQGQVQYELDPQHQFANCYEYLDSFWPRFLLEFVSSTTEPRVARTPDEPTRATPPTLLERLIPRRANGKQSKDDPR